MSIETSYTDSMTAIRTHIRDSWPLITRKPGSELPDEMPLPRPFTVPDPAGIFRHFFYWDTFYTSIGLWLDNQQELARDNAMNMLYLIDKFGYVPNSTTKGKHDLSQPPHASLQVRMDYHHTKDKEFLRYAYPLLEQEYGFWRSYRGGAGGLARYYHHGSPMDIRQAFGGYRQRLHNMPDDLAEEWAFTSHAMAEAESGWDFTPRFDRHCADFVAIDLNCLLYMHECNCAYFCAELGDPAEGNWNNRATERRQKIHQMLWDQKLGFYFDYDSLSFQKSRIHTAAAYYALLSGVADEQQARRLADNLPVLEREFGLATVEPGHDIPNQPYQWNYPNGWAPLHYAAIAGLKKYGFEAEARRLAEKYVTTVVNVFKTTGHLWEKYNVVTGGIDVVNEYELDPMMGWTAGVFLYACQVLGV